MIKRIVLGCFVMLIIAAACAPQPAPEPDQVTLQIKWVHQALFAGYYLTEELGYYRDENIDITFIEGGPGIPITQTVIDGQAMFAIASPVEVTSFVSAGEPVKTIATILQTSPAVFISMADSGITRPQDFIGKKVAVVGQPDFEMPLRTMLDFLGFNLDQVDLKEHGYGIEQIASGEVDVHGFYSTGGLLRVLNAGYDVNIIYPGDYGQHFNADSIVTTQALIDQNPDLVLRFLRATLKGWKYAIENESEAVDATMKYALESDRGLQEQMMQASIPLIHTGDNKVGTMNAAAWQNLLDVLLDQKYIDSKLDLDQVIDYQFLDHIYGVE